MKRSQLRPVIAIR